MAIIKILTKDATLTITANINFTTVEMPYAAKGFRFNGSSEAPQEELEKYWTFVEEVFAEKNISTNDYITLLGIEI